MRRRPKPSPDHDATRPPEPAPPAPVVHVVINGARPHVNVTSAIATGNGRSTVGVGETAADRYAPWTRRQIWAALATFLTVLGSVAGVIALFL